MTWQLLNAPAGMGLDGSNRIVWPSPTEGGYLVRIQAQHDGETQETDWRLNILKADFPNPVIFSTRHMDFIVPATYAYWLQKAGARGVIDGYYEFGRDLVGGLPADSRQSLIFLPTINGSHSANPIVSGPVAIGDNDFTHWRLGFLFHELGHNFNAWTRVGMFEQGDSTVDTCLHGMVEFDKIAWVTRLRKSPDGFGIAAMSEFNEQMTAESMEFVSDYQKYMQTSHSEGDFLEVDKGESAIWAGIIHEYAFTFGEQALEKCIRAIRRDGIPLSDYPGKSASTSDRFTTVMCIMSVAANHDLRNEFRSMGLPLDENLYDQLYPRIDKDMENLPPTGKNGAFLCPEDSHYYCLTPYRTTWALAESTARRLGGHLATIRSEGQEKWLANKFGPDGWLWIGYRRNNADRTWGWITREATKPPIWEPARPEADPAKTCGVLIQHEDPDKAPWCGAANRPPTEEHFGIIELDHPPSSDVDDLP